MEKRKLSRQNIKWRNWHWRLKKLSRVSMDHKRKQGGEEFLTVVETLDHSLSLSTYCLLGDLDSLRY